MIKKQPAWTFQGGRKSPCKDAYPGPGTYSPSSVNQESAPGCKIGRSARSIKLSTENPGPGAYTPRDNRKLSPRAT